jgi:Zn-dependent protease with chaperone function
MTGSADFVLHDGRLQVAVNNPWILTDLLFLFDTFFGNISWIDAALLSGYWWRYFEHKIDNHSLDIMAFTYQFIRLLL